MASREEWAELVELIRQEGGYWKSRSLRRLCDVATSDGLVFLSSFERQLGKAVLEEITQGLIAEKLETIIASDEPRALFKTAVRRRAISWLRRGDAVVAEQPEEDRRRSSGTRAPNVHSSEGPDIGAEADQRQFVFDARAALDSLSDRDRQIAIAVGLGEDREDVARAYNTSRANVDQIVSRLRKRLAGGAS